jgi:hypothetical protein
MSVGRLNSSSDVVTETEWPELLFAEPLLGPTCKCQQRHAEGKRHPA